ncbi:MAG: PAS domain S-box protein [Heteroscytonema crispum UTEX LB 1556]
MLHEKHEDSIPQIRLIEGVIQQNEKLVRLLADTAPVMIWKAGGNTLCYYFNSIWLEFRGRELAQEIGTSWIDGVHPEDRQQCQDVYLKALAVRQGFQRQYRLRRADGEYRWILDTAAPRFAKDGSYIGYIGYCVDITETKVYDQVQTAKLKNALQQLEKEIAERKKAEQALRENEAELRALFASMNDLIFVLDIQGRYLKIVPTNLSLLYKPSEEIMGKTLHEVFPPNQADFFLQKIQLVHTTGQSVNFEYSLIIGEAERWFTACISPLQQDKVISITRDITANKQAEQERQRFFEMSVDMLCIAGFDGYFQQLNPAWEETLGWTPEELKALPFIEFVHPEDREATLAQVQKLTQGAGTIYFENRYRCKDNSWRWLSWRSRVQLKEKIIYAVARDITERKRSEAALAESEIKFRNLVENANDIIYSLTKEGVFAYVSPNCIDIIGYEAGEVIGKAFAPFVHPDDFPNCLDALKRVFETGEKLNSIEYHAKHKDGSWRCHKSNISAVKDNNGNVLYCMGISHDITECKQTEQTLQKSYSLLYSVIDSTPDLIFAKDLQGRWVMVNSSCANFFGKPIAELLGKEDSDLFPPEIVQILQDVDQRIITTGVPAAVEKDFILNGVKKTHLTMRSPWCDRQGNILGVIGIARDISERKAAEQELILLRKAMESTRDAISIADTTGKSIYHNPAFIDLLGYTAEELNAIGGSTKLYANRQEADIVFALIKNGWSWNGEITLKSRSGKLIPIALRADAIKDARGEIIGLMGICTDITERKQVESVLKERARLTAFRAHVDAAFTQNDTLKGIMQACTDALVRYVDAAFARIWTLNKQENILELQVSSGIYTHINESHKCVPIGQFKIGLIAQECKPHLTNCVHDDAGVSDQQWAKREGIIAFAGYPLIVEGEIVGVIAMFSRKAIAQSTFNALEFAADEIAIGIKRKQAEMALKQSEERFRNLVETTNDGVWEIDVDGVFTYVSPKIRDILGYEPEQVLGKPVSVLMPPQEAKRVEPILMATLKSKQPIKNFETMNRHQDGHLVVMEANGVPFFDAFGNLLGYRGISRDITERKRAEESLQALVAGTASVTGEEFFSALVRHLATALEVRYAIVAERVGENSKARVLAYWTGDKLEETFEYDLANTPCEISLKEGVAYYPSALQQLFPLDKDLVTMQAESYLGASLIDNFGNAIGHIAVLDTKPILQEERAKAITSIFAARATAELLRQRTENALRQSEVRFRTLAAKETLHNRIASQIRASLDINTILKTAVSEIRNLMQMDRCYFLWYRLDGKPPYWEVVQEAKNPDLPTFIGMQINNAAIGSIPKKILNKKIIRVDDVQTMSDLVAREFLLSLDNMALLALPIHTQSGEIGALTCTHSTSSRPWLDSEVELLLAVADQLAIAIDQAELYKQSRTAAQIAQDKAQQLQKALHKLASTQAQLIQTEKMSSLGQLVAGIAHEINNPVSFIYGNLTHASEYTEELLDLVKLCQQHCAQSSPEIQAKIKAIDLDFISEDLPKLLNSMRMGADRISKIVLSLRNFSRLDEADMKLVDIHEGIDNTLMLLQQRLRATPEHPKIQVIKKYDNLPLVECYAGQLNQVFMNLLTNAIDSLEESLVNDTTTNNQQLTTNNPQICIHTEIQGNTVAIHIADNGRGITEELQQRLFDPFFTTKPVGKGTGMGLSISYQIVVEKHRGKLQCISEPGQGAEFIITIPLRQQLF